MRGCACGSAAAEGVQESQDSTSVLCTTLNRHEELWDAYRRGQRTGSELLRARRCLSALPGFLLVIRPERGQVTAIDALCYTIHLLSGIVRPRPLVSLLRRAPLPCARLLSAALEREL